MSNEQFANNASTTLGSAVGSGDTTITVATGTGANFPTITGAQYFNATLWAAGSTTGIPNEIVKVTARTGDTMTVVRGQEGTTAQAWSVGDTFANYPTAGWFNGVAQVQDIQSQTANSAVDAGTANAGVITLSPAPAALASLLYAPIRIMKGAAANTGAYTLNVNGFGVKSVKLGGTALVAGQLPANQVFEVAWDGTQFNLLSAPAVIPNSGLFAMAANTLKANLTGGSAQPADVSISALLSSLGFGAFSLTSNGYYSLPNGFIIQWGVTAPFYSEGYQLVTFPVAFPNACLVGNTSADLPAASSSQDAWPQVFSKSTTGMGIYMQYPSSGSTSWGMTADWIAFGY